MCVCVCVPVLRCRKLVNRMNVMCVQNKKNRFWTSTISKVNRKNFFCVFRNGHFLKFGIRYRCCNHQQSYERAKNINVACLFGWIFQCCSFFYWNNVTITVYCSGLVELAICTRHWRVICCHFFSSFLCHLSPELNQC